MRGEKLEEKREAALPKAQNKQLSKARPYSSVAAPRAEEKKRVELPVARNSVKFKHRPVPTLDQLNALTAARPEKDGEKSDLRRPVVAVPDIPTNSVMLYGDLIEVNRLAEALRSMDQVISTCHLKTWVVWVRGDKQTSFDVVARIVANGDSTTLASLGGGVFSSLVQVDKLQLAFEASDNEGSLEIVDQPYMQLVHAVESVITTGEEVAIPTTTSNQGVTETSIEFKQVGLSLGVTPWFLDHNRVRLSVDQENGVVGNTRIIDGVEIPEVFKQTLKTSVELRLGQTVVLGGVETAQRVRRKGYIPMTKIPISKKDERQTGHLYVVASIYATVPRAQVVDDVQPDFPLQPGFEAVDGQPFLDGNNVLPTWNKPKKEVIEIEGKTIK